MWEEHSMMRLLAVPLGGGAVLAPRAGAQEDIQKGKIKKTNADKGAVTITVDGKDRDLMVTPETKIVDPANQDVAQRLGDPRFKEGAAVMFKARSQGGRSVLVGLKLVGAGAQGNGDIQRARLKKVDLDRMTVTLTLRGTDREFGLTENTQILGAEGNDLKERLHGFKAGTEVIFKAGTRDGQDVLIVLMLAVGGPQCIN